MVKRYTLGRMPAYENNVREFDMVESPHGDFVTLSDYRTVAERCERLEQLVRAIVRGRSHCFIPTDDLSRPTFNWDERANALIAEMEKTA